MTQQEINNFIDAALAQDQDKSKTAVVSLRPGLGKSTYIQDRIKDATLNNKGLIVITDRITRLKDLAKRARKKITAADFYDDFEYMLWGYYHKDKSDNDVGGILVLTSENYSSDKYKIPHRPVILLTTQKFFMLDPAEINDIIASNKFQIDEILIDEMPFVMDVIDIHHKDLSAIESALYESITNLAIDKQLILKCFRKIKDSFLQSFDETEKENTSGSHYKAYYPDLHREVAVMKRCISQYRQELESYDPEIIETFQTVINMADDGWNTNSQMITQKNQYKHYGKWGSVVKDYGKWYSQINARVVIFDGTASIHPFYDEDCFSVIDCSSLSPMIPELTLNIYNVKASKTSLKDSKHREKIINFVNKLEPEVIFCHKDYEKYFTDSAEKTNHFGAIRGFNDYNKDRHITQVGINMYKDFIYERYCDSQIIRTAGINEPKQKEVKRVIGYYGDDTVITVSELHEFPNPKLIEQARQYNELHNKKKSNNDVIKYLWQNTAKAKERFRTRCIVAEVIQNIFRGCIRNLDNTDPFTYDLLIEYKNKGNDTDLIEVVNMLQSYFTAVNATVNLFDNPEELIFSKVETRQTDEETTSQKIVVWLKYQKANNPGRVVKKSDMLKEIGISEQQYTNNFKGGRNKELKAILDSMKIKQGYYKIPEN